MAIEARANWTRVCSTRVRAAREVIGLLQQREFREDLEQAFFLDFFPDPGQHQRQGDVVGDRQRRHQAKDAANSADPTANPARDAAAPLLEQIAENFNRAGLGKAKSDQKFDQGTLAGAGRPRNDGRMSGFQRQVEIAEDIATAVIAQLHVVYFNYLFAHKRLTMASAAPLTSPPGDTIFPDISVFRNMNRRLV